MSNQTLNIVAVILGPIMAVIITLWYQGRKQKQELRNKVFITLMTHRKAVPPNRELIESLNIVDVVFHKNKRVLELWHQYFESLCLPNQTPPQIDLSRKKFLDLLYEMARVLHYKHLKQSDMDIFYTPVAQVVYAQKQEKLQTELIRVLENTGAITVTNREEMPARQPFGTKGAQDSVPVP